MHMSLTQSDLQAIKELFNTGTLVLHEDIKGLKNETLVLHEDVKELKEEMKAFRETVQALSVSIDNLVKGVEDLKQEYSLVVSQISKHEKWIRQIAERVGVQLTGG